MEEKREVNDAKNELLINLITSITDWFVTHPQASKDCKAHVKKTNLFDEELLDEVFPTEKDEYPELDLPRDVQIDLDELEIEDIGDREEIEFVINDYLSNRYGFTVKGYSYDILPGEDEEPTYIEITDIDWDID